MSIPGTITYFTYWFLDHEEASSRDMLDEACIEKRDKGEERDVSRRTLRLAA